MGQDGLQALRCLGRRFEEYVGQSALAAELVAQGVAASQKGKVAQAATQGVETIRLVRAQHTCSYSCDVV